MDFIFSPCFEWITQVLFRLAQFGRRPNAARVWESWITSNPRRCSSSSHWCSRRNIISQRHTTFSLSKASLGPPTLPTIMNMLSVQENGRSWLERRFTETANHSNFKPELDVPITPEMKGVNTCHHPLPVAPGKEPSENEHVLIHAPCTVTHQS